MTPLPWWVLLVSLLAVAVAAHPLEHACVRLCRARDTSPEFAGVCEHQQRPVLQSGGGRFPIQRLFRLCLTPCHGSDFVESFDTTEACLAFRDTLTRRLGCSCDSLNYDGNLGEDRWEVENDQMKEADLWKMLNIWERADEKQAVAYADSQRQRQLNIESLYERIAKTMADSEDAVIGHLKTGSPMVEPGTMDGTSIDWEVWCRIQCDNGQGGSACHCDIIP